MCDLEILKIMQYATCRESHSIEAIVIAVKVSSNEIGRCSTYHMQRGR